MTYAEYGDPRFQLHAAIKGFDSAYQRFTTSTSTSASALDVFIPLTETLWWASSADEGFGRFTCTRWANRKSYWDVRNKDRFGRVFLGIYYARNRSGHDRTPIAIETGFSLPAIFPITLGQYLRWRRTSELPPPPSGKDKGLREYDAMLAGRIVKETFDLIAQWFVRASADVGI